MKKPLHFLTTLLLFVSILQINAQSRAVDLKTFLHNTKLNLEKTQWIVGLAGNVIDDDGKPFKSLFDTKKSWNVLPFPTRVTCEKIMLYSWSAEFAFSYNHIKTGKNINGDIRTYTGNYLCFDLAAKYNFNRYFQEQNWLDAYTISGLGYTMRDAEKYKKVVTLNLGVGATVWVYDAMLGVNIQSVAKFGLTSPFIKSGANYLQHSAGVVFRFGGLGGLRAGKSGAKYKFFQNRKPIGEKIN
jgi:hypothetical protein